MRENVLEYTKKCKDKLMKQREEVSIVERNEMWYSFKDNLKRLEHLASLSNRGWNGYESEPIRHSAVQNTKNMLKKVVVQPKIFPLANGNIQLEYYNREKDMDYLELEVSEIGIKDSLSEEYMDIHTLNMWLKDFYGIV